jgi:hypothetical protein
MLSNPPTFLYGMKFALLDLIKIYIIHFAETLWPYLPRFQVLGLKCISNHLSADDQEFYQELSLSQLFGQKFYVRTIPIFSNNSLLLGAQFSGAFFPRPLLLRPKHLLPAH